MKGQISTPRSFAERIRTRDNHRCQYCWRSKDDVELRIYQIVPIEDGQRRLSNHVLLCQQHYRKAKRDG